MRLTVLVFIAVLLFGFKMKKGDYVTADIFDFHQTAWAKNFKIAEVGGIDDENIKPSMLNFLKRNCVKVLGYDWMPAVTYDKNDYNSPFTLYIYKYKNLTLNPFGPFIHCNEEGYDWCEDYYLDFANPKVIELKTVFLKKELKKGFDGVFFDWASGGFINENEYNEIKAYFLKKHPRKNYQKSVESFYKNLKKSGIFVVTNQAFRYENLLKYVSYDMTESYITSIEYIKKGDELIEHTNYYPIDNKSLKATLEYVDYLQKLKNKYKKYGFKNFIYMNYIAPIVKNGRFVEPKNAIFFSYAVAKLTDSIVYAEVVSNRKLERDEIYFYDLGKPVTKNYEEVTPGVYVRKYRYGFVLVSDVADEKEIKISWKKRFYDLYNKKWIKNGVVKIKYETDNLTSKKLPFGRVYLYKEKK